MAWIYKERNVALVYVRGFLRKLMNDIEALWTLEEGRLAANPKDFALRLATRSLPDRLDTSTGVNSLQVSDDQHSFLPHVYQKTTKAERRPQLFTPNTFLQVSGSRKKPVTA